MKYLIISLSALLAVACSYLPTPPNPTPPPGPSNPATCDAACSRQLDLGCKVGAHVVKCILVCRNAEDGDEDMRWPLDCMANATQCGTCR